MIQANELRIGNIVLRTKWLQRYCKKPETWEYKQIIVDANDILACKVRPDYFKPVPINLEILGKCGFEIICHFGEPQDNNPNMDAINGTFCISKSVNKGEWVFGFDSIFATKRNNFVWGPIDYLHQLQNLYFALTGKELNPSF